MSITRWFWVYGLGAKNSVLEDPCNKKSGTQDFGISSCRTGLG